MNPIRNRRQQDKAECGIAPCTCFLKKKTKVDPNNPEGFESLIEWLQRQAKDQKPFRFIMGATGTCHQPLALFLSDHGFEVCVINPALIKRLGESMAARTKADEKDSKGRPDPEIILSSFHAEDFVVVLLSHKSSLR